MKYKYLTLTTCIALTGCANVIRDLPESLSTAQPTEPTIESKERPNIEANQSTNNVERTVEAKSSDEEEATNRDLSDVMDSLLSSIEDSGFPLANVSIVIKDLDSGDSAAYQSNTPQYPASIVKLYWAVAAVNQGGVDNNLLHEAIHNSDNNAAAKLIEKLSGESQDCSQVRETREKITESFNSLPDGQSLKLSRRTYPIPELELWEVSGCDVDIERNIITAANVSALIEDIFRSATEERHTSVVGLSTEGATLLLDVLYQNPAIENEEQWSWTRDFFGRHLPADTSLYSKVGFTQSYGRQETAIIQIHGKGTYLLTVLAGDKIFSGSETIFPHISRTVYEKMIEYYK